MMFQLFNLLMFQLFTLSPCFESVKLYRRRHIVTFQACDVSVIGLSLRGELGYTLKMQFSFLGLMVAFPDGG
jgi:hypothetical protein